uniref:Cell death regulator Aven n=1 Tax=Parasteatoda tepidariorum TaxID=114398 RepID=A0A2L2Y538_PARTP
MAPGAKKKNSNRRTVDNIPDGKKNFKNNFADKPDSISNHSTKEHDIELDQDKRFSKRSVSSNWQKYDEVPSDPHADTTRGKDFEVLLSYSGGSESQLQLQEEKDWEEAVNEKTIALDIKDLVHIVKTVPFHKQLNLPTDIFTESQLARFNSAAESWKKSYTPIYSSKIISGEVENVKTEIPENLDSSLNIIDNSASDDVDEPVPTKLPILLEDKTESIIESLASCLSLKTTFPEKKSALKEEVAKETQSFPDDLDFLLSLNVSLKNPVQQEKQNDSEKTNVDEWLNSFLDD